MVFESLSFAAMAVLVTFSTRLDAMQFTTQVALKRLAHGARRACNRLNAVLLEETYGAVAHTASQHGVSPLAMDKGWHLAWGMVAVVRIVNGCDRLDLLTLYVDQDETGAPSEMWTNEAVKIVPIIC